MNAPPPPDWVPRVSIMVNVEIGGNPSLFQRTAIDQALNELSAVTGDWYRDAATTTQIPQYNSVDSIPLPLEIWVGERSASDLLQVDGTADQGFTHWTADHAAIALLGTTSDTWFQALLLHELMLSRHLVECDDPGGLLGHYVTVQDYSAQDLALLEEWRP